jgi:hypothetical protein
MPMTVPAMMRQNADDVAQHSRGWWATWAVLDRLARQSG